MFSASMRTSASGIWIGESIRSVSIPQSALKTSLFSSETPLAVIRLPVASMADWLSADMISS